VDVVGERGQLFSGSLETEELGQFFDRSRWSGKLGQFDVAIIAADPTVADWWLFVAGVASAEDCVHGFVAGRADDLAEVAAGGAWQVERCDDI
jgi:hypothetical protein